MLKAGITGGIGSGKTTVCQVFETLGIPVFYADKAGRFLMEHDAALIGSIKELFGTDIYESGRINREKIASIVFRKPETLQQLNTIVHPAVLRYGKQWMESQSSAYVLKEAAIFFESGSYTEMDIMIGVFAPHPVRIRRVMKRDNVTQEKTLERMSHQMDEEEKMQRCDYVITNDEEQAVLPQVLKIHEILLAKAWQ